MKILITILSAIMLFFGSLIHTEKQYQPVSQEIKESNKEKVFLVLLDKKMELTSEV